MRRRKRAAEETGGHRGRGRPASALRMAAVTFLACACSATRPPAPDYSVTLDLTESIRALGSDDLFVSEPAVELLVALGPAALGPLDLALRKETAAVRLGVVDVVRQIGSSESVPVLVHAAGDSDDEVRADAILALGTIADRRATGPVEAALSDESTRVRRAAAAACADLCESPGAIERLVALTLDERSVFGMSAGRESLRRILASSDRARAAEAQRAIAAAAPASLAAEDPDQRGRAALLLADVGDRRAVPSLTYAAEQAEDPLLRVQAIAALGIVGDESAVEVLGRIQRQGNPQLRPLACGTLESLAARGVAAAERQRDGCDSLGETSKRPR